MTRKGHLGVSTPDWSPAVLVFPGIVMVNWPMVSVTGMRIVVAVGVIAVTRVRMMRAMSPIVTMWPPVDHEGGRPIFTIGWVAEPPD